MLCIFVRLYFKPSRIYNIINPKFCTSFTNPRRNKL